jgi:hypothetical protein
MSHLAERLLTVRVDEGVEAGGLQAFGLRWEAAPAAGYLTLDDALATGQLEVNEVSAGGAVPALEVTNKSDLLTFLMAGEQLAGGKQNRVLNASILVPARSKLPIPVSCVERGRWAYRSAHFDSSGSSSHSKLRRLMHGHATASYRSLGRPVSKQGEVWQEVDRKLTETGSCSDTSLLEQAYRDTAADTAALMATLKLPEGASGVVFAYGGRIVGFDLFDQPATLAKLWPKLLRAYALDARVEARPGVVPVTAEAVRTWLAGVAGAKEEAFKSPGVGEDVRLEAATLVGAGLVVEDKPVHVEVFASGGPAA